MKTASLAYALLFAAVACIAHGHTDDTDNTVVPEGLPQVSAGDLAALEQQLDTIEQQRLDMIQEGSKAGRVQLPKASPPGGHSGSGVKTPSSTTSVFKSAESEIQAAEVFLRSSSPGLVETSAAESSIQKDNVQRVPEDNAMQTDWGIFSRRRRTHHAAGKHHPLINKGASGCKPSKKCGKCTGDCDSDKDCKTGLKCFQRNGLQHVPGCAATLGGGNVIGYDYCYKKPSGKKKHKKKHKTIKKTHSKHCGKGYTFAGKLGKSRIACRKIHKKAKKGLPNASSCHGWLCTVPHQLCAKGTPGASSANYCCRNKRWKKTLAKSCATKTKKKKKKKRCSCKKTYKSCRNRKYKSHSKNSKLMRNGYYCVDKTISSGLTTASLQHCSKWTSGGGGFYPSTKLCPSGKKIKKKKKRGGKKVKKKAKKHKKSKGPGTKKSAPKRRKTPWFAKKTTPWGYAGPP